MYLHHRHEHYRNLLQSMERRIHNGPSQPLHQHSQGSQREEDAKSCQCSSSSPGQEKLMCEYEGLTNWRLELLFLECGSRAVMLKNSRKERSKHMKELKERLFIMT